MMVSFYQRYDRYFQGTMRAKLSYRTTILRFHDAHQYCQRALLTQGHKLGCASVSDSISRINGHNTFSDTYQRPSVASLYQPIYFVVSLHLIAHHNPSISVSQFDHQLRFKPHPFVILKASTNSTQKRPSISSILPLDNNQTRHCPYDGPS